MSIEHLTEIVEELETKHAEMERELKELKKAEYEARKDLFRTRFARAKAAADNEEIVLEFMKYVAADLSNTVYLWHEFGGISYQLRTMCEKLISTAKSQELIYAAKRVHHEAECRCDAYDEKCDDSDPDLE